MATPPQEQQQLEQLAEEVTPAVVPLMEIAQKGDVAKAVGEVDVWLHAVGGGYVTLERLQTVAGALPIVGNIMAAVDAVCDVIALVNKKAQNEVEQFSTG
jgi:hypothetical protein